MAPLFIHVCIRYGKCLASRSNLLPTKELPTLSGCEAVILAEPGSHFGRFIESKISYRITPTSDLPNTTYVLNNFKKSVDRHGAVGIATRYELGGLGIEFLLGQVFLPSSRQALEPTQPPGQWIPGFIPGCKSAGTWC
jgi:hypothetical protein